MIDISTTRTLHGLQSHPPIIIYGLLFGLGLLCSLLAGYRMASGHRRRWLHLLGFTAITVIIVYVMLDVEYPRAGLIRLETADENAGLGSRSHEMTLDQCQPHVARLSSANGMAAESNSVNASET